MEMDQAEEDNEQTAEQMENEVLTDKSNVIEDMVGDEMDKSDNSSVTSDCTKDWTEDMQGNGQEETSDTEFEFEFLPSVTMLRRERSASPDPAEAVLDQLYEAAQKGDSSQLVNLMFAEMKPNDAKDGTNEKVQGQNTDVNQNYAIMNMLKRKTTSDKDKNDVNEISKKQKLSNEVLLAEGSNVRNLGNLGIGNLSYVPPSIFDKDYTYFQNPYRRKNPNRTPTPPPLSPPKFKRLKNRALLDKSKPVEVNLVMPVRDSTSYKPLLPKSYTVPIVQKYKSLLTGNMSTTTVPETTLLPDKTTVPDKDPAESTIEEVLTTPPVEKNLIDYTVLTKALTKTLESKLQEGEDNDVKIVIFCNNKPIQSFSVRSNKQDPNWPESTSASVKSSLSSNSDQSGTSEELGSVPVTTRGSTCTVNPANITYINKANSHLVPTNTVPTIGDVKAILERNKMIAHESLARFSFGRLKTKNITDEYMNKVGKKDFTVRNIKNIEDVPLQVIQNAALTGNVTGQKSGPLGSDELGEGKLVINDTVTTDENSNIDDGNAITGIYIYCDICGKSFKQRRYLYRHKVRIHSAGKSRQLPVAKVNEAGESITVEHKNETLIAKIPDCLNAISNGFENENSEPVIKNEAASDLDDPDIETVLEDGNVLNMFEPADKGNRSIFLRDKLNGMKADDILCSLDKTKSYSCDYRSPVNANGLIEPVYVCEQCGKFYRARKTLKDHFLREHAKEKDDEPLYLYISGNKYQCPICFKNYHSGSELISHTKKHTGELRSVCRLCGKVYSSVHVLRRHMENVHTDLKPRPFQCELCDYAASNKWHLKEHYRRHTGEQPYKCPVCVKSFSHQGTMNRHCKTIHRLEVPSQRPYTRNNISDLPDLPYSSSDLESGNNDDGNMISSELEYEEVSLETSNDLDVDLSIVKTEPIEAE